MRYPWVQVYTASSRHRVDPLRSATAACARAGGRPQERGRHWAGARLQTPASHTTRECPQAT